MLGYLRFPVTTESEACYAGRSSRRCGQKVRVTLTNAGWRDSRVGTTSNTIADEPRFTDPGKECVAVVDRVAISLSLSDGSNINAVN